jgi:hypothetical protein
MCNAPTDEAWLAGQVPTGMEQLRLQNKNAKQSSLAHYVNVLGGPGRNRTGLRMSDPAVHSSTGCAIDEIYGKPGNFSFCFDNS